MTIYFLDTSALVKNYVVEKGSVWINNLFNPKQNHSFFISPLAEVELASALSRRVRSGSLALSDHRLILALFEHHRQYRLRLVTLENSLIKSAAQFTLTRALRAFDSVQLASALKMNTLLVNQVQSSLFFLSSDSNLLAAAQAEGLQVDNPENYP